MKWNCNDSEEKKWEKHLQKTLILSNLSKFFIPFLQGCLNDFHFNQSKTDYELKKD